MLVSIIIPCYNVESYIEKCVLTAVNQYHKDIEIICIDNNSSDNTFKQLQILESRFPQVKIAKELKPGASAARNTGLKIAKGSWIQFLDADDLLMETKISNQLKFIHDELSFIVGNFLYQDKQTNIKKAFIKGMNNFVSLSKNKLGNTCSNLFNAKYLKEVGGWNTALKSSQEADLMFRLLTLNNQIAFCEKYDTIIIKTSNSISTSIDNKYLNLIRRILHRVELYTYCKSLDLSEEERYSLTESLYNTIRELYLFENKKSLALYKKYIPRKFNIKTSDSNSLAYVVLENILGFSMANYLGSIFKEMKKHVWNKPSN